MWYADFSNMFVTRDKSLIPPALKSLITSVSSKSIKELYLNDNAFGPIGVEQFKDFLANAQYLQVLNVSNTGLGPVAASTIAHSLIANENTKLRELRMSRSRVEEPGALARHPHWDEREAPVGRTHRARPERVRQVIHTVPDYQPRQGPAEVVGCM